MEVAHEYGNVHRTSHMMMMMMMIALYEAQPASAKLPVLQVGGHSSLSND